MGEFYDGTEYLNASGDRWRAVRPTERRIRVIGNGYDRYRRYDWIEAVGNFAGYVFRVRGKTYHAFAELHDTAGVPVVLIDGLSHLGSRFDAPIASL